MTNYYLHVAPCVHCGRGDERPRHIGKGIPGWCFWLHVYPRDEIHDLDDWIKLINEPGAVIINDYDERVSVQKLLAVIQNRKPVDVAQIDIEDSIVGPNGLMRLRIDRYCIRHGDTWDCIDAEFE